MNRAFLVLTAIVLTTPLGWSQSAVTLKVRHQENGGGNLWGITFARSTFNTVDAYIAVGDGGRILRSTTGLVWRAIESPASELLTSVASGAIGSLFFTVAVGDHGAILRSLDAGSTWQRRDAPTTQRLNKVILTSRRAVAVGENGIIITAIEGGIWTVSPSGTTAWLRGLAWLDQTLVATGQGGTILVSTDEGLTWERRDSGTSRDLETVSVYGRGFIAFGEGGECRVASVTDFARVWSAPSQPPPTSARLRASASHVGASNTSSATGNEPGGTIVVGTDGSVHHVSHGSGAWTKVASASGTAFTDVCFASNRFFLTASDLTITQIDDVLPMRLANVSMRALVGRGDAALVSGFYVRGEASKRLLVRAAGPVLNAFHIANGLRQPELTLVDTDGVAIATNRGWRMSPNADDIRRSAAGAGAFAFPESGEDAAVLVSLPPGSYTAVVRGVEDATGVALVEVYDLDERRTLASRLTNLSARGIVRPNETSLLPGIVVDGDNRRWLMVRAVGPTLALFGVADTLDDPILTVRHAATGLPIDGNDNWNQRLTPPQNAAELRTFAAHVGAFALAEGSKDAALLSEFSPGAYIIEVSGASGSGGVVLVEVYDVTSP